MNSNEISEIIIQQNKGKTIIKLLYTLPILLFGIFILIKIKESLLLGACGIILLVIVAPTYFTVAKHFFSGKPLLKVNQEGIEGWGKRFKWNEIEKVALRRDWGAVYLTVYVRKNGGIHKYNINTKEIERSATELIKQIGYLKNKYE
ncbi:hypothetical protein [Listeria monocytogenes]|uniref:hypothetical protein n=1 Tax=Listeria monocytogenes TaxID=1639 RepID=UPI0015DA7501|nr:hypothetical protein [Listeria monocytogenes]